MLINKDTKVLVQGMTGKEGQKATKAMLDYHTEVVCGVTPKKGGQEMEGKPVFDTVGEALEQFPDVNTTAIYVPPFAAKDAIMEAIDSGIATISVITERIPIQDTAYVLAAARERGVWIIGPSSLGYIVPGVGRVGVVGGPLVDEIFMPGPVGVISRSGGMTNEVSWQLRKAGIGQRAAVHVGGDLLMGTTYVDLLTMFQEDEETKAVVVFGEHGGRYEFEIVKMVADGVFTKPLAVYVGGRFASTLPQGVPIGHAGAIVARGESAEDKEAALRDAGVMVAERYEDLVGLVRPHVS